MQVSRLTTGSVRTRQQTGTNTMTPACIYDATIGELSDNPGRNRGNEELPKLLSAAAATLDQDRATAKACLQRAVDLLGGPGEELAGDSLRRFVWFRRLTKWIVGRHMARRGHGRVGPEAKMALAKVGHRAPFVHFWLFVCVNLLISVRMRAPLPHI